MKNKSMIIGILMIVVVCLITTGCFYKTLNKEEFSEHFTALGYTINDKAEAKYEAPTYLVASKNDVPYKFEYYEFDTEVDAKKVYEKYKKSIGDYITTDSKNEERSNVAFSKTTAVSDNEYIIISRVKKTLIFIATTKEYQSEVDKVLEEIKY